MSAADPKPEAGQDDLPADDDTIVSVVPDPEMEAAMSEALAPVVARAANGAAPPEASVAGEGSVIEVSSAGEAKAVEAPNPGTDADGVATAETPEAYAEVEGNPDLADKPGAEPEAEPSNDAATEATAPEEADAAPKADGAIPEELADKPASDAGASKASEPATESAPDSAPGEDDAVADKPGPKSAEAPKPTTPTPVTPPEIDKPAAAARAAEPARLSRATPVLPEASTDALLRPVQSTEMAASAPEPSTTPVPVQSPEYAAMTVPSAGNRIYDHLVEGDDDVIGLITYSLYEKERRDWLQHWQRQHGSEPTAEQYEAFLEAQLTFAQRDRYRSAARQVLDAYASVAVDLEKPVIIREGIAGRVEEAAKRVENSGRWWRHLPSALLGGAVMAIVFVAIIAIIVAAGVDIAGYLGFE